MSDSNSKPVVLLIYANTGEALDCLKPEAETIANHLQATGLCDVRILPAATLADVVTAINDPVLRDRVAIVHYAGHSDGQGIQLQSTDATTLGAVAYMRGLADVLKQQPNLRLLFINGCASREQVLELTQAGIPLVIATNRGIDDKIARDFAERFYSTLGQQQSIAHSFQVAAGMLKSAAGNNVRGLYFGEFQASAPATKSELPWELHGPDVDRHWSLLEPYYRGTGPRWDHTKFAFNPESPYIGLRYFAEEDSSRFFGRDEFVQALLTASESAPLLLVIGASGTGKSSVVRAGMIPHWKKKHGGVSRDRVFVFTPQDDPFEQLAAELVRIDTFDRQQIRSIRETPSRTTLRDAVKTFGRGEPWLFFVDQFEQVFTRTTDQKQRAMFLDAIADLAKSEHPNVCLVLAMRDDFFPQLRDYPELFPLTDKHCFRVAALSRAALQEVIERPAAEHGITFQPGLVGNIIEAIDRQPGALPLLQYSLDALWKAEDLSDHLLNEATYSELGGVTGSLGRRLQNLYEQQDQSGRDQFRWMMLKLVTYDESASGSTAVSRLAPKSEFEGKQAELLDQLIAQGLVVSSGTSTPSVQLGHEKIIEAWPEFTKWAQEYRESNTVRQQLSKAASEWAALLSGNDKQKATRALWQGSQLERALELRLRGDFNQLGGLDVIENRFVDASKSRSRRLIRGLQWTTGTSVVGVIAIAIVGLSLNKANTELKTKTMMAESRQFAALARAEVSTTVESSLLLGLKALQCSPTFEAKAFLFDELTRYPRNRRLVQTSREHISITGTRFTPEGNRLVFAETNYQESATDCTSRISIRDYDSNTIVYTTPPFINQFINDIAISPSGMRIAALFGGVKQGILLLSLEDDTISLLQTINAPETPANAISSELGNDVVFSPNGHEIACVWRVHQEGGLCKSRALIWDIESKSPVMRESDVVNGQAFSTDFQGGSNTMAIGYNLPNQTGRIAFWDTKNSEFIADEVVIVEGELSRIRYSKDNEMLAASYGGENGCGVVLVPQGSNKPQKTIPIPQSAKGFAMVYDMDLSCDGAILAAAHGAGKGGVSFIDIAKQELLPPEKQCNLMESEGVASSVSFSQHSDAVLYSFLHRSPQSDGPPILTGGAAIWYLADSSGLADQAINIPGTFGKLAISEGHTKLTVAYDVKESPYAVGIATASLSVDSVAEYRSELDVGLPFLMRDPMSPGYKYGGRAAYELSEDGRRLAIDIERERKRIDVFEIEERNDNFSVSLDRDGSHIRCFCLSPDGSIMAIGYDMMHPLDVGEVAIWDCKKRMRIGTPIRLSKGLVNCLRFSGDGKMLAIGVFLGDVEFLCYEVTPFRAIASPSLQSTKEGYTVQTQTTSLAFSADGQLLAQGVKELGSKQHITLWDTQTWNRIDQSFAHTNDEILKAEFHPVNGEGMLAVLTQRKTPRSEPLDTVTTCELRMWDLSTKKPLGNPLISTTESLEDFVFCPDGSFLAAMVADQVLIWNIDFTERVRRIVGRNFTWNEWERFFGASTPYRRIFDDLPLGDGVEAAMKSKSATLSPTD